MCDECFQNSTVSRIGSSMQGRSLAWSGLRIHVCTSFKEQLADSCMATATCIMLWRQQTNVNQGNKSQQKKWASSYWSPCFFFSSGRGQAYLLQVQPIYKFYPLPVQCILNHLLHQGPIPCPKVVWLVWHCRPMQLARFLSQSPFLWTTVHKTKALTNNHRPFHVHRSGPFQR